MQIAKRIAGQYCRLQLADRNGSLLLQKITESLYRRKVAFSDLICLALQILLKLNTGHDIPSDILRIYLNQYCAVRILAISCVFAHAVDDKSIMLTGGIHNTAAGTHTEGVNAASFFMLYTVLH